MAVLLAILALGLLIIVHEGGHYLAAKLSGMRVDRFSVGFGPQIASFKRGETTFQVAAIPLGGFVQIAGLNPGDDSIGEDDPRAYQNRPAILRLFTIFAGPATNYVFAAFAMVGSFLIWGVPELGNKPAVVGLQPEMPAVQAGIQVGDVFVSIDGQAINKVDEITPLIKGSAGKTLTIAMLRDGKPVSFQVTPKANADGLYMMGAGLGFAEQRVHAGAGEAIKQGLLYPIQYSAYVLSNLPKLFSPKSPEQVAGMPGIVRQMGQQIDKGLRHAVDIVAIISVALGLFNLLPFPALDGGRMVFLGWELVTRRRFNQKAESYIHLVGLAVLLTFSIFVGGRDIKRWWNERNAAPPKPPTTQPAK